MLGGKALGTVGYKINMGTVAQDFSGGANWIAQALDATHAAATQGRTVHDKSIELNLAVAVQEAAASGVEGLVVLHHDYGFFDRVQGGTAAFEREPSGGNGIAYAIKVRFNHVIRDGPSSAVDDKNWI
jgi:hypothetical protein